MEPEEANSAYSKGCIFIVVTLLSAPIAAWLIPLSLMELGISFPVAAAVPLLSYVLVGSIWSFKNGLPQMQEVRVCTLGRHAQCTVARENLWKMWKRSNPGLTKSR
jgi:hypothetical protein